MTTENITGSRKRSIGLEEAFGEFWRHPSPWMITTTLVGALVARVWIGGWAWSDLVAPLVFVALFPVIEWVVHVFVLHWRPRQVGRWTVDTQVARKHREHHIAPREVPLVFIPWQTMIGLMGVTVVLPLWLFPTTGQALTFMVTVGVVGLTYEWVHYLVHTDYKPRSRAYRAVYKHHRLHHFKNENYWMTVTTAHTSDRLFGTDPDPSSVPTSPTAKNLHNLA